MYEAPPAKPETGPSFANRPELQGDQGFTAAIIAGIGAAVIGGAIWAIISTTTGYEVGYVAWALGGLVGFAMSRSTTRRDAVAGGTAAALAISGLLVARILIGQFALGGDVYEQVLADEESMTQAVLLDMQINEEFPQQVQAKYDAVPQGDSLSDALWEEMLVAAAARLETMDEEQRAQLASQFTGVAVGSLAMTDKVLAQLGMFDLLWAFLAVSTAWGMMKAEEADMEPQAA